MVGEKYMNDIRDAKIMFRAIIFFMFFVSPLFAAVSWCPDLAGSDDNVNFADLAILAENWQQTGSGLEGDFDNNNKVDINDLWYFADYWLGAVHCRQTIFQTFNGSQSPAGWNAYIGANSNGSEYLYITGPAGYLKTNFARNTNDDGIAKIWWSIPQDVYPAGASAGSMTQSWIQFDVKSVSGNTMANLWFGLFNSTGDTDNNPTLYNFAGSSIGGNGTSIKVISMKSGTDTYNGSTTDVRIKQRIYNLDSDTTAIETYVYAIDSEGNQGEQLAYHAARAVLDKASLATTMDSFGIRNLAASTTDVSTFLVDNFYFSIEGEFTGTMPPPSWVYKVEKFETFDGVCQPDDWDVYVGTNSNSTYSWQSEPSRGYLQTNFERNNSDDGVAKIWTDIGNLYPTGASAGNMTESWMQVDIKSTAGNNLVNLWFGLFNSNGDTDNNPALANFAGCAISGNGEGMRVVSMNSGSDTYNGSATAVRIKQRIYNLDSDTTAIETYVYALDSEGNQGAQLAYHAARTVLDKASLTTTMDSFGIRNLADSTTSASTFLVDNIYFSTDGPFTGSMPAPSWAIKTYYMGPTALGLGNGLDWNNRAGYLDTAFWADIQDELEDHSIKILLAGSTYNAGRLYLDKIGNPRHRLYISANTLYAPLFTGDFSHYIFMRGCNNIEICGISFSGNVTNFAISSSRNAKCPARNLKFRLCRFEDMRSAYYGSIGVLDENYNCRVEDCYFENVGINSHAHHIYATHNVLDLKITGCDFRDCTGCYVKLRDDADYVLVDNCNFYSSDNSFNRAGIHHPLTIDFDTVNDYEYFGTNLQSTNNTFGYAEDGGLNEQIAIAFSASGFNPPEYDYMISPADAAILGGTNTADKRNLLFNDMGIDYSKIFVYGNSYTNVDGGMFNYRHTPYADSGDQGYTSWINVGLSVPMTSGTLLAMPKIQNGDFEFKGNRCRWWVPFTANPIDPNYFLTPNDHPGLYGSKAVMLSKANPTQDFGSWYSTPVSTTYTYVLFAVGGKTGSGIGTDRVRFKIGLEHQEIGDEGMAFAVADDGRLGYMNGYSYFVPVSSLGTIQFSTDGNSDGDYCDAEDTLYYYQVCIETHYEQAIPYFNIYRGNANQRGDASFKAYNLKGWMNDDAVQGDVVGFIKFSGYNADVIIDDVH